MILCDGNAMIRYGTVCNDIRCGVLHQYACLALRSVMLHRMLRYIAARYGCLQTKEAARRAHIKYLSSGSLVFDDIVQLYVYY